MSRERPIILNERRASEVAALTIDELENGLQALRRSETDRGHFWAENEPAFRKTVLLAISETSKALQLEGIPSAVRGELEEQLIWLYNYLSPKPQSLN